MSTIPCYCSAAVLAAMAVTSCSADMSGNSSLTLAADCRQMTKLIDITDDDESRMEQFSFFIFEEDGSLESFICSNEPGEQRISVKNGKKHIYAVINAELTEIPDNENELLTATSYLCENSPGRLVMFGYISADIVHDEKLSITVKRLICKVVLKEIAVDFKESVPFDGLSIKNIYLMNVNSRMYFNGEGHAPSEEWFNQGEYQIGPADDILYEDIGCRINDGESNKTNHTFYAYPNAASVEEIGVECRPPRFTRLVLDTDIGYYTVDLPGLCSNNSYTLPRITITAAGSDSPEDKPSLETCHADIIVSEWSCTNISHETI